MLKCTHFNHTIFKNGYIHVIQYTENFFLNQSCYSYTLEVTRILTLLELCTHIHVHSTYTFIYSMYSFMSDFFIQHGTCEIHPYYHVHQ